MPVNHASSAAIRQLIVLIKSSLKANAGAADVVCTGMITLWSGSVASIPSGWALCDGSNGTPDLRGRFVLGGGGSTYAIGSTGGEATHKLTVAELPSHNHYSSTKAGRMFTLGTSAGQYIVTSSQTQTSNVTGGNAGGGTAHNNMPPYYVLAYIMKL